MRAGFNSLVREVRVTEELSVAGTKGFRLEGPLGESRLAWKGSLLVADALSGARFVPPLPLLNAEGKDRAWSGWVEQAGKRQPAKADLIHEQLKPKDSPWLKATTVTTLSLRTPLRKAELKTWFVPGTGIAQQEQRTDGLVQIRLTRLSGP